jgi:hypothetical protein
MKLSSAPPGGGFFQGASNFVMNQPNMTHNNIQNMNMYFGQGVPGKY